MPKDSEGSTGSSYVVDRKNRKILIPIDVNKIEDIKELLGTTTEEVAHGKDALEGRQDKKVAEDKSNDEEGLESLGRPANEYVKKKFGEDNNSKIKLTTDGIDLSNADVGEKVGDVTTSEDRKIRTEHQAKYKYIQIDFDRAINGAVGLTGSVFRGGASYGLTSIGYSLAIAPEPFATKALGAGFMLGGLIAGAFTASDAVESGQDVYYGVTNQRDKKSVNFGRELLGEDTYDPLNTLSVAGMPILYDQANYTKVMVEGEAAKRAIATNMANQNQISNVTVGTNKSLNIKQQEGQNPQQWQRSRDSLAQNNKNSINKTQPQGNQDYSGNQQLSKGATSKNQQGAPIFKSNKEFIYGDYKKSYTIIRPMKGKIESIKELLTLEGQAKAQNMTMQEIYDLAKKEGLNVGKLDDAGISGVGQKFDIVGNGKEKIEIKINGKKIKERNVVSIRSNSGGIHNSSYILIGTDDRKIKVIFGSPEKYKYNPTNTEKAELIFVEQPKSK